MGGRLALVLSAVLMFLVSTPSAQRLGGAPGLVDRDYILALGAANRFLAAWQSRSQEAGLGLVSPRLRREAGEERLRRYLSGLSNPFNAAYEIGSGSRLPDGRYAFDVRLFVYERGQLIERRQPPPRPSRIVLVQIGAEDWLIDEFP